MEEACPDWPLCGLHYLDETRDQSLSKWTTQLTHDPPSAANHILIYAEMSVALPAQGMGTGDEYLLTTVKMQV